MKNYVDKKSIIRSVVISFFVMTFIVFTTSVRAQDAEEEEIPIEVTSLAELVLKVQEEALYDSEQDRQRVAKFVAERDTQQRVLTKTLADLQVQEDRAIVLEKTFDDNDVKLSELEDLKAERLGAFGELFGVVRGTASEMGAQIKESIISGELTGRHTTLTELAKSQKLPSNDQLELLWFHLIEEMKAQGEVKSFTGTVVDVDGSFSEEKVVRVGVLFVESNVKSLLPSLLKETLSISSAKESFLSYVRVVISKGVRALNFASSPSLSKIKKIFPPSTILRFSNSACKALLDKVLG